jgi:hypothetical protein
MTTGFASGISGTAARQAGSLSPGKTRGGVSGPLADELITSLIDRLLKISQPAQNTGPDGIRNSFKNRRVQQPCQNRFLRRSAA